MTDLPLLFATALRRGLIQVAPVPINRSGWKAWISIRPVLRGPTWRHQLETWTIQRSADKSFDDSIEYFEVRYVELSDWHLQKRWEWDLDIAMTRRPVEDWIITVPDESTLMTVIRTKLLDMDAFAAPSRSDYPDPPTNMTRRVLLAELLGGKPD